MNVHRTRGEAEARAEAVAPGEAPGLAGTGPDERARALRAWLRLLACTNVVEGEIRRRLRERFGVTLPRFDLLAQLAKAPEGLALGELSRRMMVSNGNVTGLVERLVEDGLITRAVAAHDKRSATVSLTEKGRAVFDGMATEHAGWVAELFGDLSEEEIEVLGRLIGRLKGSAQAAAGAGRDAG